MDITLAVAAREEERRAALIAADTAGLGALLADDLLWTHANGSTDGKASYLAKLGKVQFETVETLSQSILMLEDVAAVKSELAMQLRLPDGSVLNLRSTASAVWTLGADGWVIRSFHSGNLDRR